MWKYWGVCGDIGECVKVVCVCVEVVRSVCVCVCVEVVRVWECRSGNKVMLKYTHTYVCKYLA